MAHKSIGESGRPTGGAARWLIVALLGVIAACLLLEVGFATSEAPAQVTSGQGDRGVFVVAGQVTKDSYGCFLVDPHRGTMAVYEWVPNVRKLRLMASRNYRFDLQLDDYNTTPSPGEIRKLVESARRLEEPNVP